jgi:SAM-dependent methyltransferase
MHAFPHNKVCSLEDFANTEVSEIIHDVFRHEIMQFPPEYPHGVPDSKQWEIAMSIRALRCLGALRPDAVVLGIGAGTEVTSFYLTKFVKQVVATDLYFGAGAWADVAPFLMLVQPRDFAPYDFEEHRLVVQHMDGRQLLYPNDHFDAIYSSGSIEHFGGLEDVANASYEMGRVLRPGGILTLSTEYKVAGPPGGDGWDGDTLILSRDRILRYIVDASGLELVDALDTDISEETMLTQRDLSRFLEGTKGKPNWQAKVANYPNLILLHQGYAFCSIHLALRKTAAYPLTDNAWAAPSAETRRRVDQRRQAAISHHAGRLARSLSSDTGGEVLDPTAAAVSDTTRNVNSIVLAHNAWDELRLSPDVACQRTRVLQRISALGFLYRTFGRIRRLGKIWEAQRELHEAIIVELRKTRHTESALQSRMQDCETQMANCKSEIASLRTILFAKGNETTAARRPGQ